MTTNELELGHISKNMRNFFRWYDSCNSKDGVTSTFYNTIIQSLLNSSTYIISEIKSYCVQPFYLTGILSLEYIKAGRQINNKTKRILLLDTSNVKGAHKGAK